MIKKIKRRLQKIKFILSRKISGIKNFLTGKLYTDYQKQIFDEIKIGEIIYAEMPLKDSKLFEVPEGHRVRPYIVVKKNINSLICYSSSHKEPKRSKKWQVFKLYKSRNDVFYRKGIERKTYSNSYFNLYRTSIIKINKIIDFYMSPADGDAQRLERHLMILRNRGLDVEQMNIEFSMNEGDLLKEDNYYMFIYSVYNNDIYAHPAVKIKEGKYDERYISVKFEKDIYYINYNEQIKIEPEQKKYLWDSLSFSELSLFLEKKKGAKYKDINSKKLKLKKLKYRIGQIFLDTVSNEKLIYLYNIENKIYGISYKDYCKEVYSIRRLKNLHWHIKKGTISKTELKDILIHHLSVDTLGVLPMLAKIAKLSLES